MPFTKGQSGNPGGRPKVEGDIRAAAQDMGPAALKRLEDWMMSDNPRASVAACTVILDRAYGKTAQAVEVSGKDGGPVEVADGRARLAKLVEQHVAAAAAEGSDVRH